MANRNQSILLNYNNEGQPRRLNYIGGLIFTETDKNYHLVARNSHLILSSSAGSTITISGTCYISGGLNVSNGCNIITSGIATPVGGGLAGLIINSYNTNDGSLTGILFRHYDTGGVLRHTGAIVSYKDISWSGGGGYSAGLQFWTRQTVAAGNLEIERMRIDGNGRIGIGGSPNINAALDIQSTTGSLLLPRMTDAQKDLLTPAAGMMIYNTDSGSFCVYTTAWKLMSVT